MGRGDRFRNISRIMDCVTCERCKVWGKLQVLGIGTAVRVLLTPLNENIILSDPDSGSSDGCGDGSGASGISSSSAVGTGDTDARAKGGGVEQDQDLVLSRQEVIALVNTLNQFSSSVRFAHQLLEAQRAETALLLTQPHLPETNGIEEEVDVAEKPFTQAEEAAPAETLEAAEEQNMTSIVELGDRQQKDGHIGAVAVLLVVLEICALEIAAGLLFAAFVLMTLCFCQK